MSESPNVQEPVCHECGAKLDNSPNVCWLCGAICSPQMTNLESAQPLGPQPIGSQLDAPKRSGFSFSLEGLMFVVTLVSVCMGAFTLYPGLGILLSILFAPVLVRTTMVIRRRGAAGEPISILTKLGLFLGSFVTTIVIVVVVSVTSVGTFCAVCLGIGHDEAIPLAIAVSSIATFGAIWMFVQWIRFRWRRDINTSKK